jgi:hypothetical protein
MSITAMKKALDALESSKQTHHYCEDTWYSCPKHEDGCANDAEGDECNCGADQANAVIDSAITSLRQAIAEAEKQEPLGYFSVNDYGRWEQNEGTYGKPMYDQPQPCPTCVALARAVMMDQTGRS